MSVAVPIPRAADVTALLGLLRPRIAALVAFTALPAVLAPGPAPSLPALAALLVAILLLGASCDAFNAWIERDSDGLMARTQRRPLPTGRVTPAAALAFASACGAASLALFAALRPVAAIGGALVLFHYVVVYTLWLKRRTPLNIVIGGLAGGAAPLLADLALHGRTGMTAWLLFAIVAAWTPPHFWAIALYRKHEYAAAGIPMLPVVAGDAATRRAMLRWTVLLVALSLLPVVAGVAGLLYASAAAVLGGAFTSALVEAQRRATSEGDRAAFRASVNYLALLVAAWALDVLALSLIGGLS